MSRIEQPPCDFRRRSGRRAVQPVRGAGAALIDEDEIAFLAQRSEAARESTETRAAAPCPGPPASGSTGSGRGLGPTAGKTMTRRSIGRALGAPDSATRTVPHRAVSASPSMVHSRSDAGPVHSTPTPAQATIQAEPRIAMARASPPPA